MRRISGRTMATWMGVDGRLLLLLGLMNVCRGQMAVDCSQADSCYNCVNSDSLLNLTGCVWKNCNNENATGCVSDKEDPQGCDVINDSAMCIGSTMSPDGGDSGNATTDLVLEFSQAKFDLSSFIGGIILVLALQSGVFFAMRFLKPKDSTYETIDQTQ